MDPPRREHPPTFGRTTTLDAGHVHSLAGGCQGIILEKPLHRRGIPRMEPLDRFRGPCPEDDRLGPEARPAVVKHEQVSRQHVPPALGRGPEREVVFLAVAPAKLLLVERPNLVETRATDVHAKADRRRQVDMPAGVGLPEHLIDFGRSPALRQRIHLQRDRIAGDRGIVGKRCDRADKVGAARRGEAVEPARRNDRVGIEQHHVAVGMEPEPTIRAGHKAEIGWLGEQREFTEVGAAAELSGQCHVGARIIDHHQLEVTTAGEHRINRGKRRLSIPVDRHDHVDRGGRSALLSPDRGSLGELALGGRQLVETGWVAGIESQPLEGRMAIASETGQPRVRRRRSSPAVEQRRLDESRDPSGGCRREGLVDTGQRAEGIDDRERLCHQAIERYMHEPTALPMRDGLHDMEQPQLQSLGCRHAVAGGERRRHLERVAIDVNGPQATGHARGGPLPERGEPAEPRILDGPHRRRGEVAVQGHRRPLGKRRNPGMVEPIDWERRWHVPGKRQARQDRLVDRQNLAVFPEATGVFPRFPPKQILAEVDASQPGHTGRQRCTTAVHAEDEQTAVRHGSRRVPGRRQHPPRLQVSGDPRAGRPQAYPGKIVAAFSRLAARMGPLHPAVRAGAEP